MYNHFTVNIFKALKKSLNILLPFLLKKNNWIIATVCQMKIRMYTKMVISVYKEVPKADTRYQEVYLLLKWIMSSYVYNKLNCKQGKDSPDHTVCSKPWCSSAVVDRISTYTYGS